MFPGLMCFYGEKIMKIGFEIHQQLDTKKLFCNSPSQLRDDKADFEVRRRLRPTQSELGVVDDAAMKEFLKGKSFVYQGYNDSICLVELDEEPPQGPNEEAVEAALTIALLLNARIVDEIHFMRKLVIDGSNTSGFQRTAVIAFDGYLDTDEGRIKIPTICLEEEACRKITGDDNTTTYSLDRLGIPLVEITTDPDIKSPRQARDATLTVGELLRATGRVKRGIGTIRQDINVSIPEGARAEIKGVQDLNTIPRLIETEVERQQGLVEIRDRLVEQEIHASRITSEIYDLTEIFKNTESKVIKSQLKKGRVLGVRLRGFAGLLGGGLLGREIAQSVKVHAGVRGIFHSDELPAYGITEEDVSAVHTALGTGEGDAFVLVAEKEGKARKALEAVLGRARLALKGVLEETRMARDTKTEYMRPLPGAARMYPETDILPYVVSEELLTRLRANLPETYEEKETRFAKNYNVGRELSGAIVRKGYAPLFEELAGVVKTLPLTTVASIILDSSKHFMAQWIMPDDFRQVIIAVDEGRISKEAVPKILEAVKSGKTVDEAISEGLGGGVDLESLVDRLIAEKADFIKEKGEFAVKPIMGLVMKEARGRVDGKLVNEAVKKKIEEFLAQ
ncbi:aspartyl/glutamyl-tRNA(Asn/Gln) amidotransferase subunit B [archaeon BMS3Abin16]|nr:aspartyl/glutamyl-tRNA(Asn/Gln) amidotransferase subunit B [archaeon BMS3Abin16]